MAASIKKIAKAIEGLKDESDRITGAISGAKARRMYLQAEWIADNLKEILFKSNGWKEES